MKKISDVHDMRMFLDGVSEAQHAIRLGIHTKLDIVGIPATEEDVDCLRDEVCSLINSHVLRMLRDQK